MLALYVLFTLFSILGSALPVADKNSADGVKYWSLPARKVVRDTHVKKFVKRDEKGDWVDLSLTYESTFYVAEVALGSNSQKLDVLLDTGSSDFWVISSENTYCAAGTTGSLKRGRRISSIFEETIDVNNATSGAISKSTSDTIDCSEYGTFDPSSSTTFHSNGTSFGIAYDDNTFAKGTWGQDTLKLGSIEIKNMNIAVCDNTDNNQGVLGIGLPGLEVTSSNSGSNQYEYENLPMKLVSDGIISKAAYSVYLDASSGSEILFGAVDSSKYEGDLVALPIINALESDGINSTIQLTVTVNSLSVVNAANSQSASIGAGAIAALLDTGTTLTYAPDTIVNSFVSFLGLEYSDSIGYYVGACSSANNEYVRFNFQGLQLDIPLSNFFISLTTSSGQTSSQCAFGILSSGSETYMTLGQSFLQSVYMVADLEDMKIALAKSSAGGSQNITAIESVIPQAKHAQQSSAYGSVDSAFNVAATPTEHALDLSTVASYSFSTLTSLMSSSVFTSSAPSSSLASSSVLSSTQSSTQLSASSSPLSTSSARSSSPVSSALPSSSHFASTASSKLISTFVSTKHSRKATQSTSSSAFEKSSSASASTHTSTFSASEHTSRIASASSTSSTASSAVSISQKNTAGRLSTGLQGIALMLVALL